MPFSAQRCALLWQRPTFSLCILISLVSVTETSDMKRCLVNICAMQRLSVCVACLRIWSGPLKCSTLRIPPVQVPAWLLQECGQVIEDARNASVQVSRQATAHGLVLLSQLHQLQDALPQKFGAQ